MSRKISTERILISNDDGIDAYGLKVLERIARQLSDDVWIVAPEADQSGMGHSLTLSYPLRIRELEEKRYAISGTPTDCVVLAVKGLLKDKKPTLILSGVNHSSNLGEDITYSGTVAVALEAAILNIPSIALSQGEGENPQIMATAEHYGLDIVRQLIETSWPEKVFMNVNFPDVPPGEVNGIQFARQGQRRVKDEVVSRNDPRNRTYYWIGATPHEIPQVPDTDLMAAYQKSIVITPLSVDMTDYKLLEHLQKAFKHGESCKN